MVFQHKNEWVIMKILSMSIVQYFNREEKSHLSKKRLTR